MVYAAPGTRLATTTGRRRRSRSRHGGRDDTDRGRVQGRRRADEALESSRATVPSEQHDIAVEQAASCLTTNQHTTSMLNCR